MDGEKTLENFARLYVRTALIVLRTIKERRRIFPCKLAITNTCRFLRKCCSVLFLVRLIDCDMHRLAQKQIDIVLLHNLMIYSGPLKAQATQCTFQVQYLLYVAVVKSNQLHASRSLQLNSASYIFCCISICHI